MWHLPPWENTLRICACSIACVYPSSISLLLLHLLLLVLFLTG